MKKIVYKKLEKSKAKENKKKIKKKKLNIQIYKKKRIEYYIICAKLQASESKVKMLF